MTTRRRRVRERVRYNRARRAQPRPRWRQWARWDVRFPRARPLPAWDQSDGVVCKACGGDATLCPCWPATGYDLQGLDPHTL